MDPPFKVIFRKEILDIIFEPFHNKNFHNDYDLINRATKSKWVSNVHYKLPFTHKGSVCLLALITAFIGTFNETFSCYDKSERGLVSNRNFNHNLLDIYCICTY